jgi:hypothetical protein
MAPEDLLEDFRKIHGRCAYFARDEITPIGSGLTTKRYAQPSPSLLDEANSESWGNNTSASHWRQTSVKLRDSDTKRRPRIRSPVRARKMAFFLELSPFDRSKYKSKSDPQSLILLS